MIKCVDKGIWTCIGRNNIPKKKFVTDNDAIKAAKLINEKYKQEHKKLVAYKCTHCQNYHLLTVNKKIK